MSFSTAHAQDTPTFMDNPDGLVRHAYLWINDEVTENCWTNSASIRSKLRLMFEQNDVAVVDERFAFTSLFAVVVTLEGLGFREENGRCISTAQFEVYASGSFEFGGIDGRPKYRVPVSAQIFSQTSVFASGQNNNDQMSEFFEAAASEYLADVISGRRSSEVESFFGDYPDFGAQAMTISEWEDLLESAKSRK